MKPVLLPSDMNDLLHEHLVESKLAFARRVEAAVLKKLEQPRGNVFTPVDIHVLLQVYYNAEHANGLADTPAHRAALKMWERMGCIYPFHEDGLFCTTDRGHRMVEAWRQVQLVLPTP